MLNKFYSKILYKFKMRKQLLLVEKSMRFDSTQNLVCSFWNKGNERDAKSSSLSKVQFYSQLSLSLYLIVCISSPLTFSCANLPQHIHWPHPFKNALLFAPAVKTTEKRIIQKLIIINQYLWFVCSTSFFFFFLRASERTSECWVRIVRRPFLL